MELMDYVRILRRHWLIVVAGALLGVIAGGAISLAITRTYTASTQFFVAIQNTGTITELQQGNSFGQARVQSYIRTAKTPAVLQPTIDSLGLDVLPSDLAERIKATADLNTVLITISASDSSPATAAAIAQAVGESLIQVVDRLESPTNGQPSPVRLSVLTPAVAPVEPSAPDTKMNIAIGLLAGLALGLGIAVLRSALDVKVRGEADVKKITNSAILGGISFDEDAARKPLLTQTPPLSPRAESFRQLRTNLQFSHVSHSSKTVLITSSLPGEGKSTTAINLAIALAQSGQTVALIDADLRRPMVGEYLGLERNAGLTTALVGSTPLEDLLRPWGEDQLFVLTSGQIPPNPSELLGSEAMKQIIKRLENDFDAVIIDAPPLLPVTDAAVLSQLVGGVVLVVGSQQVKTNDVEKSLAALEMVKAEVLGIVLNLVPGRGPDAYDYYSYETKPSLSKKKQSSAYKRGASSESANQSEFDQILFPDNDASRRR